MYLPFNNDNIFGIKATQVYTNSSWSLKQVIIFKIFYFFDLFMLNFSKIT